MPKKLGKLNKNAISCIQALQDTQNDLIAAIAVWRDLFHRSETERLALLKEINQLQEALRALPHYTMKHLDGSWVKAVRADDLAALFARPEGPQEK